MHVIQEIIILEIDHEWFLGKDLEDIRSGLFESTILAYVWR
jgi:hypothetical protein